MGDADSQSKPESEGDSSRQGGGRRRRVGAARLRATATKDDVLEEDISIHIFTTSATLVGVCLTVIGLFRVIVQLKSISTWGDDLLSVDALLFLVACLLSYRALRTRNAARRKSIERVADAVFMAALALMALICCLITYAFI